MVALRLSISNLAWPAEADHEALDFVAALGFDGVEIAPRKVFGDPAGVSSEQSRAYRRQLADRGLAISALQGVLFGTSGVHLFASKASRQTMAERLQTIAALGGALGAGNCVFGAPMLRDPGALAPAEAFAVASEFFQSLAPHFAQEGLLLCFEAVPASYGCRFAVATEEAFALVERVDAVGFALLVDTATIFVNGENPTVIAKLASRIGHVHVSEPHFAPVGTTGLDHQSISKELMMANFNRWITIEMKSGSDWRSAIRRAYGLVSSLYCARDRAGLVR